MSYENYQITLLDRPNETVHIRINEKEGLALQKERRKLYIIYHNKDILYVGEANSSILTRFQRACTSFNYAKTKGKSRNGYSGYKWLCKKVNPQRTLQVFTFNFNEAEDENRDFVEAVEGELVFLIRKNLNYWPKFQNEIHFKNVVGAYDKAKEILEKLFIKMEVYE